MKKHQIAQHLRFSTLFSDISRPDLEKYADSCRIKIVQEGDYVYRQGDPSDLFYIIGHGEAELVVEREDGGAMVVGRIGQGGHFGETGILAGKPRSVCIRALFDLVLICFEPRIFRSVLLVNHLIQKKFDAVLAERLRVAYLDQASIATKKDYSDSSSADDVILFRQRNPSQIQLRRLEKNRYDAVYDSKTA